MAIQFVDSKGRKYTPRINCRVIERWERATGRGLFEAVFSVLAKGAQGGTLDPNKMFELAQGVFGHLGNTLFLLYEACRPAADAKVTATVEEKTADGYPRIREVEVEYNDFLDSVTPECVFPAVVLTVNSLVEFFPVPGETDPTKGSATKEPSAAP